MYYHPLAQNIIRSWLTAKKVNPSYIHRYPLEHDPFLAAYPFPYFVRNGHVAKVKFSIISHAFPFSRSNYTHSRAHTHTKHFRVRKVFEILFFFFVWVYPYVLGDKIQHKQITNISSIINQNHLHVSIQITEWKVN